MTLNKRNFTKKNDQFLIDFKEANQTTTYTVSYTFGHFPLQQYLIEAQGGRYQVFPFAWNSRSKNAGGLRWYAIYTEGQLTPADRIHWQQPLQNWNGMCADCHSTGLKRHYDAKENMFNSEWQTINVSCLSCHADHTEKQDNIRAHSSVAFSSQEKTYVSEWVLDKDEKVASLNQQRDNRFMDSCFACHALRSPLTDGFQQDKPFLDQFSPNWVVSPFYHADGQIKEEVYVYGSFLQSKMYRAGVNCLDCHDPHSMQVKIDGNGLCLQCHNAEVYQQPNHLMHPANTEAAQCVTCHMPETT
jgi:predicted CXXCH cytochrome family protein